jgi:hypothetical protein
VGEAAFGKNGAQLSFPDKNFASFLNGTTNQVKPMRQMLIGQPDAGATDGLAAKGEEAPALATAVPKVWGEAKVPERKPAGASRTVTDADAGGIGLASRTPMIETGVKETEWATLPPVRAPDQVRLAPPQESESRFSSESGLRLQVDRPKTDGMWNAKSIPDDVGQLESRASGITVAESVALLAGFSPSGLEPKLSMSMSAERAEVGRTSSLSRAVDVERTVAAKAQQMSMLRQEITAQGDPGNVRRAVPAARIAVEPFLPSPSISTETGSDLVGELQPPVIRVRHDDLPKPEQPVMRQPSAARAGKRATDPRGPQVGTNPSRIQALGPSELSASITRATGTSVMPVLDGPSDAEASDPISPPSKAAATSPGIERVTDTTRSGSSPGRSDVAVAMPRPGSQPQPPALTSTIAATNPVPMTDSRAHDSKAGLLPISNPQRVEPFLDATGLEFELDVSPLEFSQKPKQDTSAFRVDRVNPHLRSDVVRNVSHQIAEMVRATADGTVEVRLSPEELGRVRLSMTPGEGGLHVAIHAERPETLDLMRRNVDLLAKDLRQQGHEAISFSFGQGRREGNDPDLRPFYNPMARDPANDVQLPIALRSTSATVSSTSLDLKL